MPETLRLSGANANRTPYVRSAWSAIAKPLAPASIVLCVHARTSTTRSPSGVADCVSVPLRAVARAGNGDEPVAEPARFQARAVDRFRLRCRLDPRREPGGEGPRPHERVI